MIDVEDWAEIRRFHRAEKLSINAIVELQSEGRPPVRRPGVTCRWCPLAESCDDGQAYLNADPED